MDPGREMPSGRWMDSGAREARENQSAARGALEGGRSPCGPRSPSRIDPLVSDVSQGGGGGSGGGEEPPGEEEFGFITINLEEGYLPSLEQALFSDVLLFDQTELTRDEERLFCNSVPQASLFDERRQLEFNMVESFFVNHGGTKQVGESCIYSETQVHGMNDNSAEGETPDFEEDLTITNE